MQPVTGHANSSNGQRVSRNTPRGRRGSAVRMSGLSADIAKNGHGTPRRRSNALALLPPLARRNPSRACLQER